ncbi:HD domain-containing protein [Rhizobium mongolense]|uniref:(P)ppGpp synthase/HD superfamily hydrolase n=1 Tax=Rhizobium mongolense TaxID=57676 RepID=A0A7W6RNZ2_9HYPH|nr:HD domain-containing protein [Rhizobium mongolense]MBB4275280.1 (p)ppGpp synthase/HD superfamily hydrolase [Rhizobium mongolense]
MQSEQHLQHAIQIATEAHDGQQDKLGNPYFDHCRRVADAVSGDEEKVVAYLHDVPEKAWGWTLDRLKEEGFSQAVLAAVDALTKRQGEEDEVFVRRAIANRLARPVKQADLEDNLDQARQAGGDTLKYERGLATIANVSSAD